MKALFKYKLGKVFKLKRTYFLILGLVCLIFGSFLLKEYTNFYKNIYLILLLVLITFIVSYIFGMFIAEDKDNTLMLFLKIDKKKYKGYLTIILLLGVFFTTMFVSVLFVLLKTFNQTLDFVLMSLITGLSSIIYMFILKKYI